MPSARLSAIGRNLRLEQSGTWQRFALLTVHRQSNTDDETQFRNIMIAAAKISEEVPVVFPVHPRTRPLLAQLRSDRILVMEPLGYLSFLYLMEHAAVVLTDSGGVQDETTALDIPCLTLRENTERPLTIDQGTNILVGTDPEKIVGETREALRGYWKHADLPWNWDGHAAERIAETLSKL